VKVVVLAGGTGGAALASGLYARSDVELTVIANTADDDEFWGLLICPDIDAVIYRLAGIFNAEAGYGVKDESFHVLEMLRSIGEAGWFNIGDKDLATHLIRGEMLRRRCTLTEASLELCRRFDLHAKVIPMSDEPVRTRFTTDAGELSFQEYFVRERLRPRLIGIEFAGIGLARPTPEVVSALRDADLVVIGPSNPLISIAPILRLAGEHVPRSRTVAVTPIVGGTALKGPTVEMMNALGRDPNPVSVASMYRDLAFAFVLDERDRSLASQIEELDYRTIVCDTVMRDGGHKLAECILGGV
jgi:LPPG:FO 2-phospho-L-lactate transferase